MKITIYLKIENLEEYPNDFKSPVQTFNAKEFKKNGNVIEIFDVNKSYFIIPIDSIIMIEINDIEKEVQFIKEI